MALEETGLMTPIKKKGGRHADQPVESAAPEQRQATQLGSPASLVGWTRRLCLAALHTQKARPSRPDLHEGLRLHRQTVPKLEVRSPAVYTQVDVVAVAVVTGIGKKKKQRGRSDSDAPPKKKKEFLPSSWSTVFCACAPWLCPSWRTTGAQSLPRGQPPGALQRGPDTHLLPQGCLRA